MRLEKNYGYVCCSLTNMYTASCKTNGFPPSNNVIMSVWVHNVFIHLSSHSHSHYPFLLCLDNIKLLFLINRCQLIYFLDHSDYETSLYRIVEDIWNNTFKCIPNCCNTICFSEKCISKQPRCQLCGINFNLLYISMHLYVYFFILNMVVYIIYRLKSVHFG